MPNFSEPSALFVAAGIRNTGPAPQMIRPDLTARKAVITMSPIPLMRTSVDPGCDVSGMMTRRMTFVLLLIPNGMTG